jgi:hypothetical protein
VRSLRRTVDSEEAQGAECRQPHEPHWQASLALFPSRPLPAPSAIPHTNINVASLQQLRYQARSLYKEARHPPPALELESPLTRTSLQLHYLAREYPDPNYPIHARLHACFLAHVGADEAKLEQGIKKAEFIKKGTFLAGARRKRRAEDV